MIITIKTAVTFNLPKEKALMEEFERNNSDWVMEDATTTGTTFKRTQIFGIGGEDE